MSPNIRDGLLIVAITLALFGLLEAGSRIFWSQASSAVYLRERSILTQDDQIGWVNRPCAHAIAKTPEFTTEYQINRQGFRDAIVHSPSPRPGVTRILLLGDSFTFGQGNEYDKNWPVILERELNRSGFEVEVINDGVCGYDTRQEVLNLERLAQEYHPGLVVLVFLPNDLFTNTPFDAPVPKLDAVNDLKHYRTSVEATLTSIATHLNIVELAERMMLSNDSMYDRLYMMTPRARYFANPPAERLRSQLSLTEVLLERGMNFCKARGLSFAVLSLPQEFQVLALANGDSPRGIDVEVIDSTLSGFAQTKGTPWFAALDTMASAYKARRSDLYYRSDGHLTNAGNEVVAGFLADQLVKRGLVSRPVGVNPTPVALSAQDADSGCGPDHPSQAGDAPLSASPE